MSENIRKAYSEIDEILQLLQDEFVEKIPVKLREIFSEKKDNTYIVKVNPNEPLENQNLLPETIGILALLKLDYWCENEKEKQELLELFNNNEINYQHELEERYSSENMFNYSTTKTQISLIDEKKSIADRILNFIRKIFRRNK